MSELLEKNAEFDQLVRAIGESYTILSEQAYAAYAPLVDDICTRVASENEVDHFLDYLLDFAGFDRMLPLFKRVCQQYYLLYPDVVAFHVELYSEEYGEEACDE